MPTIGSADGRFCSRRRDDGAAKSIRRATRQMLLSRDVNDARPLRSLPRTLGFWSSVGLVVGITIGSGIFRTPAGIARLLPDPIAMLAAWTLGGIITLCGALSFAGLAQDAP